MTAPHKSPGAARWEALAARWARHGKLVPKNSARDAVALGVQLLMLKDAAAHGTWRNSVNAMGLEARSAERFMALARHFANAPAALFDAIGSASKMTELLPLDEAQDLAQGGEVHGLTLERIKPMTVLELRKAVRTACARAAGVEVLPLTPPKPVRLSVDEERMLRLFRQCSVPAREALFSVAGLLAKP